MDAVGADDMTAHRKRRAAQWKRGRRGNPRGQEKERESRTWL